MIFKLWQYKMPQKRLQITPAITPAISILIHNQYFYVVISIHPPVNIYPFKLIVQALGVNTTKAVVLGVMSPIQQ